GIHFEGSPEEQLRTIRQLSGAMDELRRRGARIPITFDATQAQNTLRRLAESAARGGLAGTGIGGGLLLTGGSALGFAAVAIGVQHLTETVVAGTKAGIAYNAQLEAATSAFTSITGSAQLAQEAIERLTKNADITPFDTEEVIRAGQSFITTTHGSIDAMEQLVKMAERLAAVRPGKTLDDAT